MNSFESKPVEQYFNELRVYPTYAVIYPQRSGKKKDKSIAQIRNEENLTENKPKGKISDKARKRLTNAVNWLIISSKRKRIYDKANRKHFYFRLNFITLTLPTLEHNISDHHFKSKMLHNFINQCRYKYGMKNYVWKVEAQANGNIHAHFTTDCFIHWKDLRKTWNNVLENEGLIDKYREKHENLTYDEYSDMYSNGGQVAERVLAKRFKEGCKSGWSDPNSTDVKAVKSIADIGAYMAKYMGKNEDDRREIKGRLWSCSYSLSDKNKLVFEIPRNTDVELSKPLMNPKIDYFGIYTDPDSLGNRKLMAEVFFYKMSDWGKALKGRLYEAFRDHCSKIRNGLAEISIFDSAVNEVEKSIPKPKIYEKPLKVRQGDLWYKV